MHRYMHEYAHGYMHTYSDAYTQTYRDRYIPTYIIACRLVRLVLYTYVHSTRTHANVRARRHTVLQNF